MNVISYNTELTAAVTGVSNAVDSLIMENSELLATK